LAGNGLKPVKVKQDGASFLVFQNVMTRLENFRLKQQLMQREQMDIQADRASVVKQMALEAGVKEEELEKYSLDLRSMTFVPAEEEQAKKKTTRKKAPRNKST